MKKLYRGIIIAIIISVFLVCFLIGRATALKSNEKEEKNTEQTEILRQETMPSVEANNTEQKVPEYSEPERIIPEVASLPPEKMLFPCGKTVLKDYSQSAVYSETMGDWRAHTGIDYSAEEGQSVLSAWEGTVTDVYKDKLWGYTVEIKHSGNLVSVYKNLDKDISVKKGQYVNTGQAIGKVGKSADIESLEPSHLHFELWKDTVVINPISYVY